MYSMLLFLLISYALEDTSLISQRPDNNIILYCFLIKVAVILLYLNIQIWWFVVNNIQVSERQIPTNRIGGIMVSAFVLSAIEF